MDENYEPSQLEIEREASQLEIDREAGLYGPREAAMARRVNALIAANLEMQKALDSTREENRRLERALANATEDKARENLLKAVKELGG